MKDDTAIVLRAAAKLGGGASLGAIASEYEKMQEKLDESSLRSQIESRVRIVHWKQGDVAPTGKLYEEAYPQLTKGYKAYMVYIDDVLVNFQVTAPGFGPMRTKEDVTTASTKHKNEIIDQLMSEKLADDLVVSVIEKAKEEYNASKNKG